MSLLDDENILIEQTKSSVWEVAGAAVINNAISQEVIDYLNENLKIQGNGRWSGHPNWGSPAAKHKYSRLSYSNGESVYLCISIFIHVDGSLCIAIADQKTLDEEYGISHQERLKLIKDIMQQLDMFTKDDI